jgi:uncharacterized SAM-binding protein YcdF (DUF218 family)
VFFYFSKAASWLLEPLNLLICLELLGMLLLLIRCRRTGLSLMVLCVLSLLAVTFLPIPQWALHRLEHEIPRPSSLPNEVAGIVLLGGGQDGMLTEAYGTAHLLGSAERTTSFAALARRYPRAKLVFTGGSGSLVQRSFTEAEVVELFFQEQGLDARRLLLEDKSRTTYENATLSKALAQPNPGDTWILVTSAAHMPRSVAVFRKAGWNVLPYPVGYRTMPTVGFERVGDAVTQFDLLGSAIHEWVGLLAYRMTGRI